MRLSNLAKWDPSLLDSIHSYYVLTYVQKYYGNFTAGEEKLIKCVGEISLEGRNFMESKIILAKLILGLMFDPYWILWNSV